MNISFNSLVVGNLNDDAHFAYAITPPAGPSQAFIDKNGVSVDLGIDRSLIVRPLAINNNDEVVALTSNVGPGLVPQLCRTVVSRDTVTGRKPTALAANFPDVFYPQNCVINGSGQIAFEALTGNPDVYESQVRRIWLITNGQAQVVASRAYGTAYSGDRTDPHLVDFNDAGVMLLSDNTPVPPAQSIAEGFTWKAGVFNPLAFYTYSTQFGVSRGSGGNAITDAGQVIGYFVYNGQNTAPHILEDLIDYTSDVPRGRPVPILSERAQLSVICANKVGQIVISLDIPVAAPGYTKKILALLTPS